MPKVVYELNFVLTVYIRHVTGYVCRHPLHLRSSAGRQAGQAHYWSRKPSCAASRTPPALFATLFISKRKGQSAKDIA